MSTVSGAGGSGGLPLEVMQMMDEVSRDQRKLHRDAAHREADMALEYGLEEADQIREQAEDLRNGAIWGGAMTAASGMMTAGAGVAGRETLLGKDLLDGSSNLSKQGEYVNQGFQAAAKFDEGDAREASARSQAAGRRAEAEQAAADEAQKQGERARELYSQMLDLEHASVMSSLSQKA